MQSLLFSDLGLNQTLLANVAREGYNTPTPIQAQSIPILLAGNDLVATAQTGTGKTAAFMLPVLQYLALNRPRAEQPQAPAQPSHGARDSRRAPNRPFRGRPVVRHEPAQPMALVLVPTRELAVQVADTARTYGAAAGVSHTVVFGGAPKGAQITALQRRPALLVATPGRLLDLMNEGHLTLDAVSFLILDEADRMLDMGFIPDVTRIIQQTPQTRQTALFSATMPAEIRDLAAKFLRTPQRIAIEPAEPTVRLIDQSVMHVGQNDKIELLRSLIDERGMFRTIVFTRTKHRADRVAKALDKQGLRADSIHGNKSQNARQRALDAFRRGAVHVLVATDVAARGIDVDDISHVINFEIPHEPETYVHRIGRTARAGASGAAISFCDREEYRSLRLIEKLIGREIRVDSGHGFHVEPPQQRAALPFQKNRNQRGTFRGVGRPR